MNKKKAVYKTRDNVAGYVLMAPWLVGFLGMWLIPAIISIYYSFTNFNLLNTPKIIGLSNYILLFTQDERHYRLLLFMF